MTVNVARNDDLRPLTKLLEETLPAEEWWDGSFRGSLPSGEPFNFRTRMQLRLGIDILEGRGVGIGFPKQAHQSRRLDMSGTAMASRADFSIFSFATYLRSAAILCHGVVDPTKKSIRGLFSLPCFQEGCDCKVALKGRFVLRKRNA